MLRKLKNGLVFYWMTSVLVSVAVSPMEASGLTHIDHKLSGSTHTERKLSGSTHTECKLSGLGQPVKDSESCSNSTGLPTFFRNQTWSLRCNNHFLNPLHSLFHWK